MWGIIATWRMAFEGIGEAATLLAGKASGAEAVTKAVSMVEDFPFYKSVGYGGLPNENGVVELDAAFMDGTSLSIGAVASVHDLKNPVQLAYRLSKENVNNLLVGLGAEEFATRHGFERRTMLTERALQHYAKKRREMASEGLLTAYDGHDTVGMIALDQAQNLCAATSTSGLFMKKRGRVGDSPLSGSGFYADSAVGGATATGLGEDLMKGCLSYEIVRLMGEGHHPQEACDQAVAALDAKLKARRGAAGDLSVVAMNKEGQWGAATNIDTFSFTVATEKEAPAIYLCERQGDKTVYRPADQAWLDAYEKRIREPVV